MKSNECITYDINILQKRYFLIKLFIYSFIIIFKIQMIEFKSLLFHFQALFHH